MRTGFLVVLVLLCCVSCATQDKDYVYRATAATVVSKADLELRLRANIQFFLESATGKVAPTLAEHLSFEPRVLAISGNQYLKYRYGGAAPLPAKRSVAYSSIGAIKLMKKGNNSFRVFLLDSNGIELLRAVATNRDVMWQFVDALVHYGALNPAIINDGNSVETVSKRR